MVVDQQREIGICAHGQTASMGVEVRGLYVYQVDWARAPHYNHLRKQETVEFWTPTSCDERVRSQYRTVGRSGR